MQVKYATLLSFWFRFDLDLIPSDYLNNALVYLPYVVISQSVIFWYFGLYKGVWRFSSLPDLIRIFKSLYNSGKTNAECLKIIIKNCYTVAERSGA
jgi:FlaA1/EpsC-like NDP-sugar epimerase